MNPLKALDKDEQDFIEQHLKEDPTRLALKYHGDEHMRYLVSQIKARQQIRKKLPEWYKNFNLKFPTGLALEQASSEATAKLKSQLISGDHLLDITGGLGIDTYYLSRSFHKTTYVEQNEELASHAAYNFESLKAGIDVVHGDGVEMLRQSTADVVYIDPYRRDEQKNKLVSLKDYQPDVTRFTELLTLSGRKALIKASPMLDIKLAASQLRDLAGVWVISHRNDCKELVFLLDSQWHGPVETKTFNITSENVQEFQWTGADIQSPGLSMPLKYVYEPNSAVLKAGVQDALATSSDLYKLHPNSNFFTSEKLLDAFPGKSFEVKEVLKAWDKSLKGERYNVISRNFPAKANEIEKRLKLLPSDHNYLLATRLSDNSLRFISCRQIPN